MKTRELTGIALDWAVASAEGADWWAAEEPRDGLFVDYERTQRYSPSTDWSQGGPIINRHIFRLEDDPEHGWLAEAGTCQERGETALIAAMRCYVASKLGAEVEVPADLLA
jgi:hypothetical protein